MNGDNFSEGSSVSISPEVNLEGASFTNTKQITLSESGAQSSTEQSSSWAHHGLSVHIEQGTLSETQSECNFTLGVTCNVSECFGIPPDVEAVSAIYCIQPSVELHKPVKLDIEHCCSLQSEEDAQSLVAMLARVSNSNQTPPYTFKFLQGGEFPGKRSWGSISVSVATSVHNLILVVSRGSATVYHAKVCYRHQNARLYNLGIALCRNLSHCKVDFCCYCYCKLLSQT